MPRFRLIVPLLYVTVLFGLAISITLGVTLIDTASHRRLRGPIVLGSTTLPRAVLYD